MPTDLTPTRKLRDLQADQSNVRFDSTTDVEDLAQSIASVGLVSPITVRRGTNIIVAGHRRFAALQHLVAQLEITEDYDVPVYEMDVNEEGAVSQMLVENMQRVDLTPMEEAHGINELATDMKQKEIAKQIGKSPSLVSSRLRLLKLPSEIQELVHTRLLDVSIADLLTKLVHREDYMLQVVEQQGRVNQYMVERWIELDQQQKQLNRALKWVVEAGGTPVTEYDELRELNLSILHEQSHELDCADAASVAVAELGDVLWVASRYDNSVLAFGTGERRETEYTQGATSTEHGKAVLEAKKQRNAVLAKKVASATQPKGWYDAWMEHLLMAVVKPQHMQTAARYLGISKSELGDEAPEYFYSAMQTSGVAGQRHKLALLAAVFESLHGAHNPPSSENRITHLLGDFGVQLDNIGAPVHYDAIMKEGQTDDTE